jgi:DNA-binding Lrp family transcriptional regulator
MSKKIEYVGTQIFTDESGNKVPMAMIAKQYDAMDKKGWRRAIIGDLMEVIEQIGNKKIKVMEFLIDSMNGNNEIDLSQREVEKATGISLRTVNETFKALVEAKLLKKIKRKYVLNTQIISAFGSSEKNKMLCINYGFNALPDKKMRKKTLEEQLLELENEEKELNELKNGIKARIEKQKKESN